jgi:N-acetylneuraminic acid mutarotase
MKKKSTSQSAFFNLRILTASVFCLLGIAVALFAQGSRTKQSQASRSGVHQDAPGTQRPDVVQMVGPVRTTTDVRHLPYVAPKREVEERRLTRYPFPEDGAPPPLPAGFEQFQAMLKKIWRPTPKMPGPLLTFDGISAAQSGCGCFPPDSNGDVGPNHYVNAVNSSFRVFDKSGNPLTPATTFNSLFAPLGNSTPCGNNQNDGDPFAFYDQLADRWVISDFAFPGLPGSGPFFQCIAVSTSPDPAGTYNLYAVQHEPTQTTWVGDYPKMALWDTGGNPAQNAYFLTVNLVDGPSLGFEGVRVFALDRASMLTGGPANAIGFTIGAADVGASYSFVAANFRAGNPPPAGRDEFVLAIDSPATGGVTLTQVHGRLFHVDFVTPANSTFGVGPTHQPNAEITVDGFVDAFTNTTTRLVPQQGTAVRLDTLGDKIMTPVVYRFDGANESLWASNTVCTDAACTGPTGIRWYQFDVTGGAFPATPVQQQTWTNNNDGLWRWMPSIAVDQAGNTAIGYSVSSPSMFPGIRYAGRLSSDPSSDLGQGEATMFNGSGNETDNRGRWGDYTMTSIDPADGMTFWHVNQYLPSSGTGFNWVQRIGKFDFVGGGGTPTPTPTATPAGCSWSAGPDLPSVGTRFAGVFFPANGKFYAMGGRNSDNPGTEFTHPFEYDPGTNAWTTKSATYPDIQVNNIACGVLNESGTDYIYCVGGSDVASQTTTGRVFRYDPVTDTISTIGDPWPPGAATTTLPGGFTVANNNLFILGGFDIPGGNAITDIWQFDPSTNAWEQKNATLPVPLGYIPTTTIGGLIYTGGGSDITGGVLTDTTNSFVYDPGADSISTIAPIPRATGETRALNFNGQMYVMGGGRTPPNPGNEVDIYDPGTNTWSIGIPFVNGRRNFATDTDGTTNIWLVGGYDVSGVPTASMEIFNCPQASPTPTPSATATATATITPPPSPTPTATVRPTPTPRPRPTPFPRPTP